MPKRNVLKIIISITILLALCGCSTTTNNSNARPGDTTTLNGLIVMGNSGANPMQLRQAQLKKVRYTAIQETALSTGAQAGLASRAEYIDSQLTAQAAILEQVYNFNALMLAHNILPPVLLEGRSVLNLADPATIRLYDRTYKIAKQARFVTAPLNWRQYLWLDYKKPERPSETLLPQDAQERALWNQYITIGWNNGTEQANNIFADNLARLNEDFRGMILYRKLLALNMISPPYISRADLGITGDQSEIHIDDQILRITALPGLNTDSKVWRPVIAPDQDSLAKFRRMDKLASTTRVVISDKAWQPVIPETH